MSDIQPPITLEMVDGTKVVVPDSLDQITPYVLQEQGDWFEDEIKFLRRLVQPGQTVVDIGANMGVYALSLARRVGPTGQVWAFEPASATAELLEASIAANGTTWLQLQRQALSDHSGTAWLQTLGQSELNSLGPEQGPGEEVPLTTLDACLEQFGWQQVDLLKIDAEGEEERILAGGQHFFAELSPLVMFELKAGTELHLELVDRFNSLGYACYRLVPGLDALMPFDPAAGVDGYLLNLFAAKPDRATALAAGGWLVPAAHPQTPEPPELQPYHWSRVLTQLPYGQALALQWEQHNGDELSAAATEPLALWAFAQDLAQPIDQRLGALQQSYRLLSELAREKDRLTHQSSLARVAWELGERTAALRALGHLIPALEAGIEPSPKEPFLPPSSRFDGIDPNGRLGEWLDAAALEGDEQLGHYSSYFSGTKARPRLERLQALGFTSVAVQQRLAVLNRRFPPRTPASPEMERPNADQITCSEKAWELIEAGDIEGGKALLDEARRMGDRCSKALHFIAKATFALGKSSEAVVMLQRAVELDTNNPAVLLELGISLKAIGDPAAAEAVIHQAVWLYGFLLASGEPRAGDLSNLGIAFHELGDTTQALEYLDQALEIDPGLESALRRKATIFSGQQDHHDAAMEIWGRLQANKPEDLGLIVNRAILLIRYGEMDEAIALINQVLSISPSFMTAHGALAFAHSISGERAVKAHLAHLQDFWHLQRAGEARIARPPIILNLPKDGEKLRVGFLSAELGDHVVSKFLEPFLTHYDRSRFEVELIEVHEHRSLKALQLGQLADAVLTVQGLNLEDSRQRIRSRGYNVIVETSGFTQNSGISILADRCAPVQCHYIGFHASTGLETIDWFIGDELTAAEELSDQYVEKLWRLPRLWLASNLQESLPKIESLNHGSRPILGSFNQFGKVREETLGFWAAAMELLPAAKLHLKNYSSDSERPQGRILQQLERSGVDPSRVHFLPRTASRIEHLECYRTIDVALDTTPWAGATTTFDALSMGVPVVGILGGTTAGRMTSSILRALGKVEWITTTPTTFADAVERLVSDLAALRAGRLTLQQNVLESPLFNGRDLTRHLQDTFTAMVSQVSSGPGLSKASTNTN